MAYFPAMSNIVDMGGVLVSGTPVNLSVPRSTTGIQRYRGTGAEWNTPTMADCTLVGFFFDVSGSSVGPISLLKNMYIFYDVFESSSSNITITAIPIFKKNS